MTVPPGLGVAFAAVHRVANHDPPDRQLEQPTPRQHREPPPSLRAGKPEGDSARNLDTGRRPLGDWCNAAVCAHGYFKEWCDSAVALHQPTGLTARLTTARPPPSGLDSPSNPHEESTKD